MALALDGDVRKISVSSTQAVHHAFLTVAQSANSPTRQYRVFRLRMGDIGSTQRSEKATVYGAHGQKQAICVDKPWLTLTAPPAHSVNLHLFKFTAKSRALIASFPPNAASRADHH